jgi:pimeloyl-ACP methyl ester carboxylesterase
MRPGEMIDIGGRRLHVLRRGHGGPTVVLEAGGAGSSAIWWPLQDQLSALTSVVCYDRAGLGWSDAAPLPRTIEQRATDLATMLAKADVAPPYVLVGLSYGGPLIRLFAARHPQQVAGMVFVDIAHEAVFTTPGAQTYLRRSSTGLRLVAWLAKIGLLRLLRMRGLAQSPPALPLSPAQIEALNSRYPTAPWFRTGADEFTSMLRIGDSMSGLAEAGTLGNIPVAVISHGKPFPGPFAVLETNHLQGQRQLAALSRNSLFVVAEHSSHAVPLEEPEVVIDVIRRVVESARNGTPLMTIASPAQ